MTDAPTPLLERRGLVAAVGTACVVLALALYWGATGNDFIWDDPIVFQRQLPYFDSLGNVFFPPDSIPQFGIHYYRPATVLSYLASERAAETFWPLEERDEARRVTFHAAVVAWNAVATLLVFLLGTAVARGTGRDRVATVAVGAAAAVLFATHPIHTEAVNWMAGCADVLCTVFVLAAMLFYLRARRRFDPLATALFGASALAAMLAKETGVALVFLVGLVELIHARDEPAAAPEPRTMTRAERRRAARDKKPARAAPSGLARRAVPLAVLGLALLVYFSLRHAAIAVLTTPAPRTPESIVSAVFGSIGWYASKTIWPLPLSAFVSGEPGAGLIVAGLVLVVVIGAALAWHALRGTTWHAELFAAGFFMATLAPALAIALLSISETRLAERYLYLPSAGACLLAALLLERGARAIGLRGAARAAIPLAVAILVAIPSAWVTLERADVWRTDLAFWEDAVQKAPDEGLPFLHLGIAYANIARDRADDTSQEYYQVSLEQYRLAYEKYNDAEGRSKALNNKGSIHMQLRQYPEAIEAFRGALDEVPAYPTAYYNWSLAEYNLAATTSDPEARKRHFDRSLAYVRHALELNPRYVKAHLHYGKSLRLVGQETAAREHFEQVVRLAPASREGAEARRLLGR